jgi:hypothetical protein
MCTAYAHMTLPLMDQSSFLRYEKKIKRGYRDHVKLSLYACKPLQQKTALQKIFF